MSLVTPGDVIGVEEEAIPVNGAYIDKNGYIRSNILGLVLLDKYKKTVSVKPLVKRVITIPKNTIVEGIVVSATDELAVVKIYHSDIGTIHPAIGLLHISQVSETYVHSLLDYVKPSDVIKAKILTSTSPYLLSIKEPSTGVILAHCSYCGAPLYLKPGGTLTCRNCDRTENRKIAVGYMYVLR